ncbi:MAG: ribosome biogenesis GTPase Der [Deltaproteobacteria bacterium]|nr:ribosome biogenesis GTPase Der [Deltaproteobacteria bacterium]MBW2137030.1 ribosome biogenesis GTPase Der [Deltaproteobacteria bacterium]
MTLTIAIVGRPNVGKSTLFNRLSRSRDALVDNQPGVTRDRLYAPVRWEDKCITIIDTGGFDDKDGQPFHDKIKEQIALAIEEADRIIFMVDGRQGLMPGDQDVAELLRHAEKDVFLAVNKIDGPEQDGLLSDFYALGIEKVYPLSAAHGYGLKSLMEALLEGVHEHEREEEKDDRIRVSILGRPNVGKSSLINRILGFERLLVSDLPGTTRDSVDTLCTWQGRDYLLIDTAGLRRRGRVKEKIEKFSMIKSLRSLDRCHIAVVLLDAGEGIVEQDAHVCGYALERGRGVILAVNKWDILKGHPERIKRLNESIDRQLQFVSFAPRVNLSALTGEKVTKLFSTIDTLYRQFTHRVGTGAVNKAVEEILAKNPPPRAGRGRVKVFYATQTDTRPPTFVVFVNRPEDIHFSYKRFLINQFRERFQLGLTPIRLVFRKRS